MNVQCDEPEDLSDDPLQEPEPLSCDNLEIRADIAGIAKDYEKSQDSKLWKM